MIFCSVILLPSDLYKDLENYVNAFTGYKFNSLSSVLLTAENWKCGFLSAPKFKVSGLLGLSLSLLGDILSNTSSDQDRWLSSLSVKNGNVLLNKLCVLVKHMAIKK